MLAVAPSTTKHENAGVFALNRAPLFCGAGDGVEETAAAATAGALGVASTSTDDSAVTAGSDSGVSIAVSEADSDSAAWIDY